MLPSTPSKSASSKSIDRTLDFVALLKITQTLASKIELDELLQTLTQTMLENSGANRCALILAQDDRWLVRAMANLEQVTLQSTPLEDNPTVPVKLIQYVKNTWKTVLLDDPPSSDLPITSDYLLRHQPKSVLCLPILDRGNLAGILYLENRSTSGVFTSDRILILNFLCTQAAIYLENARLYAVSQEKLRLLALRMSIDSTLTQEKTLKEMLRRCSEIIVEHLKVAFVRIWTLNESERVLELQASAGLYTHINGAHSVVPVGKFKIGLIALERLPHLTNDVLTDPRVSDKDWARREGIVAFAGYPLMVGDRLLGVMAMFARRPLSPDVLDALSFIAGEIARGIERQQIMEALQISEATLKLKARALEQSLQDLKQAQLQTIQNEKMATLGNLVAGVAHEINNPLGFIGGNLGAAQEHLQDLLEILSLYQKNASLPESIMDRIEDLDPDFIAEDFPKIIESMRTGCDRIREIGTSLRTFSRTDANAKTELDLHEGIDSTLLILKYRLQANDERPAIEVVKNYGNFQPVKCYPGQLNQVFMNLLANALDALEESNRGRSFEEIAELPNRIVIKTSATAEEVIIRIADNGTGMPLEVKQRIFEQGFTTKGVGKGTGLGMAIARQIVVEKHGGKIACTSELGKGTEFAIVLPI